MLSKQITVVSIEANSSCIVRPKVSNLSIQLPKTLELNGFVERMNLTTMERLWNLLDKKVVRRRDIIFMEEKMIEGRGESRNQCCLPSRLLLWSQH